MPQRPSALLHGDITERIIGAYHAAHYEFGNGFLEKLCQRVMVIALRSAGLDVTEAMPIEVYFRRQKVGVLFADIVVNDLVLVEVKSCPALDGRHTAQVLNYLRASRLEVGLLVNFGPTREFERLMYSNDRKTSGPPVPSESGGAE